MRKYQVARNLGRTDQHWSVIGYGMSYYESLTKAAWESNAGAGGARGAASRHRASHGLVTGGAALRITCRCRRTSQGAVEMLLVDRELPPENRQQDGYPRTLGHQG
jgi:hypothetical protein